MNKTMAEDKTLKKENVLVNIIFNVVIPVIILSKFSNEKFLGPFWGLAAALIFPLSYGLHDFIKNKKRNLISALGFFSILLTGVVGLLKFPPELIAVKEAMIPFLIGVFNLVSLNTKYPLVKTFIFNREIFNIEKIESAIVEKQDSAEFEKLIAKSTIYLSGSFFFSAILNYVLAKIMVTAAPGTILFNEQLAKMALLSYPVIALPSVLITGLICMYLFSSIKKLTGLSSKQLFSEKISLAFDEA